MGLTRRPSRRSAHAAVVAALAFACTALPARVARADMDFTWALGAGVLVSRLPDTTVQGLELPSRVIGPGVRVPNGSPVLAMPGLAGEVGLAIRGRYLVPLLGLGGYWAAGSYDETVTSIDGSVARTRPWTASRADVLLPGLGLRVVHRRNAVSATIRTGASFAFVDGEVAAGNASTPFESRAGTFLVQVELEACRRLDPVWRACLFAAPRVHDFGLLSGAAFGLRVEVGR